MECAPLREAHADTFINDAAPFCACTGGGNSADDSATGGRVPEVGAPAVAHAPSGTLPPRN